MGTRSAWARRGFGSCLLAAGLVSFSLVGSAWAGPKEDIEKKNKEAMENYDLMDYAAAKKGLDQALAIAKKNKLDKDPLTARVYLSLGIAAFANGDLDGAKLAFLSAVQIDAKIQIDAAYKSPELTKLLDEARSEAGGSATGGGSNGGAVEPSDAIDCATVKGLQHTILDAGKTGAAQPIEAYLGSDVAAVKVAVSYRVEGATDFTEVKMAKSGGCKYTGQIPGAAMKGAVIHYFVAAYDNNNKPISAKGSSGSPNIMELTAGTAGKGDIEDPIGGSGGGSGGTGGDISGGVIAGGKPPKVMIILAAGTGFGYVTGSTEGGNQVRNCCVGNSLIVLTPELGFYVNPRLSIGIAGRIGLPIGANVEGHATLAPAAVIRVRYGLSDSGEGVRVMGQVGGGIMRNTIKLDNAGDGMDTDIVAQGPLLVGAGIGFTKKLGGSLAFVADLSALAGIAVVDKLGTSTLNSGVSADLSLGLALGF